MWTSERIKKLYGIDRSQFGLQSRKNRDSNSSLTDSYVEVTEQRGIMLFLE